MVGNVSDARVHIPDSAADLDARLLQLIDARDTTQLSQFLTQTLPQLPAELQEPYNTLVGVQSSFSKADALLKAAARLNEPRLFKIVWDTLYLPHIPDKICTASATLQIPYECLKTASRNGDISLGRTFVSCEPPALSREPPIAFQMDKSLGRGSGSQIMLALMHGRLEYIDFIRSHGIDLNHEWPRVKLLRTVVGLESLEDDDLESRLRWLIDRGARVEGAGALQRVARYRSVEAAEILLETGIKADDLEDPADHPVETALMEAVREGRVGMVKLFINHGADVDWKNSKGQTPLRLAEADGKDEILSVLRGCEASTQKN